MPTPPADGSAQVRLSEIWIYPVKALRGIPCDRAAVEPWGLRDDRRWMVVDANDRFLTQRSVASLARISATTHAAGLTLGSGNASETCEVAYPSPEAARRTVTVWRDTVEATAAGPDVDRWLTATLGIACRLVYMAEPRSARPVDPAFGDGPDRVSFADGFPLLVTSQGSLDDLNGRLLEPVPMNRFRPNLVVEGPAAWQEDSWTKLTIGEVLFDAVKPCDRCVVTTIDQDTGLKATDVEPLRTMQSFRRNERGLVLFGQNLIPRSGGTVHVGDAVTILDERSA